MNVGCSIDGCSRPAKSWGLCNPHYMKAWHAGETPRRPSAEELFWAKVDKNAAGGCWLWTSLTRAGYGTFKRRGQMASAHLHAHETLVGPVPEGLQLDHLCPRAALRQPGPPRGRDRAGEHSAGQGDPDALPPGPPVRGREPDRQPGRGARVPGMSTRARPPLRGKSEGGMSFDSWGQIVIVGLGVLSVVACFGLWLALTADPNPRDREDRR